MDTLEYKPLAEIGFCIEGPRARQEKGTTMFKTSLSSGMPARVVVRFPKDPCRGLGQLSARWFRKDVTRTTAAGRTRFGVEHQVNSVL